MNNFFEECVEQHGFCFIAEISNNHLRDLDRYYYLIEAAKLAGAHSVKIQTYSPQSLIAPGRFDDLVTEGPWKGQTFYSLYNSICAPVEWSQTLFDFAKSLGIYLFSSPFSSTDIRALELVGCPAYKIASFEFTDVTLWDTLCDLGKPILASTGIATAKEVESIVGNSKYRENLSVLFNCVSSYPSNLAQLDVSRFDSFSSYGCLLGLSDHSIDVNSCIYAHAMGARVFEKHFTLNRLDGGPDASFSLEPDELKRHIQILNMCSSACLFQPKELALGLSFGRVVYSTKQIFTGDLFTLENVGNYRPFVHSAVPAFSVKELLGRPARFGYEIGDCIRIGELEM